VAVFFGALTDTADDAFQTAGLTPSAAPTTSPRGSSTPVATKSPPARTTTVTKVPPKGTDSSSPAGTTSPEPSRDWEMVPLEVPESLAPVNEAVIENSATSTRRIRICRQWGNTSCRGSSRRGYLEPGENSAVKFKWADVDGFQNDDGWVKVAGCFGCTVVVTAR
jgi:hypothetical protein